MDLYLAAVLFFRLFCNVVLGLLFVRIILSWLSTTGNDTILRLYELASAVTDPVLAPARAILRQIPGADDLPLDLSPIVTILLLSIINIVLFGG